MTIWLIHIAFWINKATNTVSEYLFTYYFSTSTTVSRTRFNVALYVHCLSSSQFSSGITSEVEKQLKQAAAVRGRDIFTAVVMKIQARSFMPMTSRLFVDCLTFEDVDISVLRNVDIYLSCFVFFLFFCTTTNNGTIISQIITLLHVSTLSCHPQRACNQLPSYTSISSVAVGSTVYSCSICNKIA